MTERIAYEVVAEVDIDAIGPLEGSELEAHFRDIGTRATASQLRRFLDGAVDAQLEDDDPDKDELVDRFVRRRMKTVGDLRVVRKDFDVILVGIVGSDGS